VKGTWVRFTTPELDWIKQHCTMVRREAHAKFVQTFAREDVSFDNYKALCTRKGWQTGRDGRFDKDCVSWNKGNSMPYNANTAATQFKKGQKPWNEKFEGHERVTVDGYVEISVRQVNPYTGFERRYVQKHQWLWELEHGAIPVGMVLKSLDGNKANCKPENWKLIPRAMLARLAGKSGRDYDHAPDDVKPTLMAMAELETKIQTRRRS
jgi:hypothetical protein